MDVESRKDDISNEDSNLVVFLDTVYKEQRGSAWIRKSQDESEKIQVILNGACGALRPGRLTFILGPSGAGKTSLLKILAKRKETLKFAASLKLPKANSREREHAIETVSAQLGIQDVLHTKAGRMSGGERKRLTIACELLTNPTIMLLDEPTSGLDSVSSMSVARALRTVAGNGRTVACVIHQPSSKLFTTADDVILMAEGRTLYAGAIDDVPDMLARAGFRCPQYYNMADYLLEIASGEHNGNLSYIENEAKSYTIEMSKIAKNDVIIKNGKVYSPEAEALLSLTPLYTNGYIAGFWTQFCALLWRCSVGARRDVYLTQLLCATIFLLPAWYLTSQPMDIQRVFLAWIICVLITILAQTFGFVLGAACDVKLGMFVVPAANIPMLMFSEFFIPYHEMPFYLRPFAAISYFRYAFDAFIQTAYGFDRERLPCNKAFCMFKNPQTYLNYLGLNRPYLYDVYALLIWIIETVSSQLGIQDVLNTKAGRMSGGERKRLTIACELLTNPAIMLLDEPTSGLDSVSSMSVARALRTVAGNGRTVACVIHQPSSKLFSTADDVILMAEGRTLYAGAIEDAPDILANAGFRCPQYYNMADYFYPAEAESLLNTTPVYSEGYTAGFWPQLCALLWRSSIGACRDVHLTQIRLSCHVAVALLLGALYCGAGAEADRIVTNTSCLFFFLLFLFFSNSMPTVNTFPAEATVVLQEHLNKWYSLPAYCIAKILMDLPVQLLCATVFLFPAWYLTSQPMEIQRLSLAWAICVLITILAQTYGLVVGTAFSVKVRYE
ncbi:hypothetical protein MSG28_006407 [Choristoneura fumiferana]|uniref:Uncharacterized protein n=1 Tax=Choristoneura fumiferana TaxID=7141 RepID=A0ACC0JEY1_CHOFU|nr:hypothetical protein MSG28_006407 [Choristoneura fumiferana]